MIFFLKENLQNLWILYTVEAMLYIYYLHTNNQIKKLYIKKI